MKQLMTQTTILAIACALSIHPAKAENGALDELLKKYDTKLGATKPANPEAKKPVAKKEVSAKKAAKTITIKSNATPEENIYGLQVSSHLDLQEAQDKMAELSKKGFTSRINTVTINEQKRYRVMVGGFPTVKSALAYKNEQNKDEVLSSAIVANLSEKQPEPTIESTREPASTAAKPIDAKIETATAEKQAEEEEAPEEGLLGDWGGVKSKLSDAGIDVQLKYKSDTVSNLSGGVKTGSAYLGNVDLTFDFNLEKIMGLKGLNLVLYGLGDHGANPPTDLVGDTFGTSNIQAPSTFKLYEAYLKKAIDDRFTVLVGLRDLNADYYAVDSASTLVNSAFGISPTIGKTGYNGPSIFPNTALAIEVKYVSPESFYFQTAAFNARAGDKEKLYGTHINSSTQEGSLYIAETGFSGENDGMRFKYSVGAWTYSKYADAIDTTKEAARNSGFYFLVDQSLTKNITFFAKHGLDNEDLNQFSSTTETGFQFTGLIPSREEDQLTLGYATATASKDYKLIKDSKSSESVAELSYRISLPWGLALTPDYQFIINPGLSKELENAQVLTLRLEVLF